MQREAVRVVPLFFVQVVTHEAGIGVDWVLRVDNIGLVALDVESDTTEDSPGGGLHHGAAELAICELGVEVLFAVGERTRKEVEHTSRSG